MRGGVEECVVECVCGGVSVSVLAEVMRPERPGGVGKREGSRVKITDR